MIIGSEGNFGIITEAVIKVRPIPEVRIFDSILFYDWESGVEFMRTIAKTNLYPTSCRLVDNQ
jgi:alkyldihydroxyacetonephosphate synthase